MIKKIYIMTAVQAREKFEGKALKKIAELMPIVGRERIEFLLKNPHLMERALEAALATGKDPVWENVSLIGQERAKDSNHLLTQVRGKAEVSDTVMSLIRLKSFSLSKQLPATIVVMKLKDLDFFIRTASVKEVKERLDKLGFANCPNEAAFYLATRYKGQGKLVVIMQSHYFHAFDLGEYLLMIDYDHKKIPLIRSFDLESNEIDPEMKIAFISK